jgi:hypothetical protein
VPKLVVRATLSFILAICDSPNNSFSKSYVEINITPFVI